MLRNLTAKLKANLPATTHGYSMVKFASLNDAFSEFLELEASPVEGQSLQQKDKKKRKRKAQKKLKQAKFGIRFSLPYRVCTCKPFKFDCRSVAVPLHKACSQPWCP